MGTLKNDHLDGPRDEPNGKEPRVFGGWMATKKVKMYVTVNEKGECKVYNTFKGFSPMDLLPDGRRKHPDMTDCSISTALIDLGYDFATKSAHVTSWHRSLEEGIRIGPHEQKFYEKTYTSFARGLRCEVLRNGDHVEMFVPHGGDGWMERDITYLFHDDDSFAILRRKHRAETLVPSKERMLHWLNTIVYPYSNGIIMEEKEEEEKEDKERKEMILFLLSMQQQDITICE